jgi:hypothetical protein
MRKNNHIYSENITSRFCWKFSLCSQHKQIIIVFAELPARGTRACVRPARGHLAHNTQKVICATRLCIWDLNGSHGGVEIVNASMKYESRLGRARRTSLLCKQVVLTARAVTFTRGFTFGTAACSLLAHFLHRTRECEHTRTELRVINANWRQNQLFQLVLLGYYTINIFLTYKFSI